ARRPRCRRAPRHAVLARPRAVARGRSRRVDGAGGGAGRCPAGDVGVRWRVASAGRGRARRARPAPRPRGAVRAGAGGSCGAARRGAHRGGRAPGGRRRLARVYGPDLMRFLFRWQHVEAGTQLHGRPGLLEIIGQLQGVELPARRGPAPTRALPLALVLREDLGWLLAPTRPGGTGVMPASAQAVLDFLERRGACFVGDIARGTGLLPGQAEEALWRLVARGLVPGGGVAVPPTLPAGAERRRGGGRAAVGA